jgi:hypothetical protein
MISLQAHLLYTSPSLYETVVARPRNLFQPSYIWDRRQLPQIVRTCDVNAPIFRNRCLSANSVSLYFILTTLLIQVTVLHAEMSLANARVAKAEGDKDRCHADLIAAEARADRAQTASTQAARASSGAPEKEENESPVMEEVKEEDSDAKVSVLASMETNDRSVVNGHGPSFVTEDDQHWKIRYDACDQRNQELVEEVMGLKSRCSELTSEVSRLNSERLRLFILRFAISWLLPV